MAHARPNLFLIGAMKSGTSSLHTQLAAHPEIFMSAPKEPCYFVDPEILKKEWPEMWGLGYWKSEASYLSLFSSAGDAKILGESSTDYSKLPLYDSVSERIWAFNPDARFIYIMRDPIERTLSHYWHMAEHRNERRPLMEAICQEPHYQDVSHYAMQLSPYLDRFGHEQIFITTFEEYKNSPDTVLTEIYDWLDVSPDHKPGQRAERQNVTPAAVTQTRGKGYINQFRYSRFWEQLGPHVPRAIRNIGRSLAEKKIVRKEVDQSEAINYLRPIQQAETDALIKLLGREFPQWKTLYDINK